MANFWEKLETRIKDVDSLLCAGLDPHITELFPDDQERNNASEQDKADAAFTFCKTIIDATAPHVCCFKPNIAFFEALGPNLGLSTLVRVVKEIPDEIPILLDCKRGDIGSTAQAYAHSAYQHLHANAVTVSPLMGWDSIEPFVKDNNGAVFLLCKTSNPGSKDFMELTLSQNDSLLYEHIARQARQWMEDDKLRLGVGLVVGATDVDAMKRVRQVAGSKVWILAPGVGFQGGNLLETLKAGLNEAASGLIIPVSRGISRAPDPAQKAQELKMEIRNVQAQILSSSKSDETPSSDEEGGTIKAYQRDFVQYSLKQGVLKFGSFVLKSGRTSPYFFNAGLFATGGALHMLGRAYASAIMASPKLVVDGKAQFDVLFGPAYKGISLGAVVASALYHLYDLDVGFAYNRKEAKDHGEGGVLVGASVAKSRILIVDDVITAGTAIRETCRLLEQQDEAKPVGVVIALDRAEKRSLDDPVSAVQALERDLGLPVVSIVNLVQLQAFLKDSPDYDQAVLDSVAEYRSQYGV